LNSIVKQGLKGKARPAGCPTQTRVPPSEAGILDKMRVGQIVADPWRNPLEFASLPGSPNHAVGDKPDKSRITYIAEVTHGAPEFHRPRMFVFDECRESLRASFKKRCTYFCDEPSSDTLSPMRWGDCKTIDVPAPSVPSADYRSDNFTINRRDQKKRCWLLQQKRQPLD
jgi:hypothetical protein